MRPFSGPITIERLVDMFINLFIWRLMMRIVDIVVNKLFTGIGGLFGRKQQSPLLPPETQAPPQINDFSRRQD